jgi:single-strand DNA-binding protein
MAYEMKGTLVKLMDRQDFPSGFFKRDFVVRSEEQYPQDVKFTLTKERVELLNAFQEGQTVQVSFDVRGREYNGNYYVDLNAWRLSAAEGAAAPSPAASASASQEAMPEVKPMPAAPSGGGESDDDLPF